MSELREKRLYLSTVPAWEAWKAKHGWQPPEPIDDDENETVENNAMDVNIHMALKPIPEIEAWLSNVQRLQQ